MPADRLPPAATASLCRGLFTRGAFALGVLRLAARLTAALRDLLAVLIQFVEEIVVSGHLFIAEFTVLLFHLGHR